MTAYVLVNFGGPRSLNEIAPFLTELLTDRDVVRSRFSKMIHNWFFSRVARKRALKIQHDYAKIGGSSPIFADTEAIALALRKRLGADVFTFHRYLPATHTESLAAIEACPATTLRVIPLFPQFCYATTGSIARRLSKALSKPLEWIRSYATHPAFLRAQEHEIRAFLTAKQIPEHEALLLFSAHGVPQVFIDEGDPYQSECEATFRELSRRFPTAQSHLCYQSKFGRGEWIEPATDTLCRTVQSAKRFAVLVPMSFTTDHIETLFEIEEQYVPLLRARNFIAHRCPALGLAPEWLDALAEIAQGDELFATATLVRR